MGRRGFEPTTSDVLARRGSGHTGYRKDREALEMVQVEGPGFLDHLAHAIQDRGRHHLDLDDISLYSTVGISALKGFVRGKTILGGESIGMICETLGLKLGWVELDPVECESEGVEE